MNPRYSEQKKNFTYGTGGFTVTSFDCIINGSIKLHNFGRYKRVEENKKTLAQYFESIPYLDPQHLKNPKRFFRDEIILV